MSKFILIIFIVLSFTSCKNQEPRYPISVSSGIDYNSSIELSKKINQKEEKKFRSYIKSNNLEMSRSNYGFWYKVKEVGDSLIKTGDVVSYSFIVEDLNKKIIYPEKEVTVAVDMQNQIKGMHEGLKLMSKNSEAIFIFPSHQAYGFHGDDNKIKTNTPLVYKVKVGEVKH